MDFFLSFVCLGGGGRKEITFKASCELKVIQFEIQIGLLFEIKSPYIKFNQSRWRWNVRTDRPSNYAYKRYPPRHDSHATRGVLL
jgi:hypothetical protein